jgi:hypothetical protein
VDPSQLALQPPRLQGLSRATLQPARLLQQAGLGHHQGTPFPRQPIDFASWKSKIITKNLVDSVKTNFEDLSTKEYDLDKVFTDIFSKDSKAIDEIVTLL